MTTKNALFVVRRLTSLVVVSILLLVGVSTPSAGAAVAERPPNLLEIEFLQQLNAERSARGLSALQLDTSLDTASRDWAAALSLSGNLVHSNDGRAEIIAYGYRTGQITLAWMNSPGHRHLAVDPNLGFAGIGVACDSTGRMWAVVQFRRIDTSLGTQSASSPDPKVTANSAGSGCGEDSSTSSVRRLYLAFFKRDSDAAGLAYWVSTTKNGSSLSEIADFFATSPEFQQSYGSLSDRDFVRQVYENVMGRTPDASGYSYWVQRMSDGLTRGELMIGFSESQEFRSRSGIS